MVYFLVPIASQRYSKHPFTYPLAFQFRIPTSESVRIFQNFLHYTKLSFIVFLQGCFDPEEDKLSPTNLEYATNIRTEETNSAYECFLLCQKNSECETFSWITPKFNGGKLQLRVVDRRTHFVKMNLMKKSLRLPKPKRNSIKDLRVVIEYKIL